MSTTESPSRRWLRAKSISAGLFPSERIVTLETLDGTDSLFVPIAKVDEDAKTVLVEVLEHDEQRALVRVPSQEGASCVRVDRNFLGGDADG
jgi:hypothetical protein